MVELADALHAAAMAHYFEATTGRDPVSSMLAIVTTAWEGLGQLERLEQADLLVGILTGWRWRHEDDETVGGDLEVLVDGVHPLTLQVDAQTPAGLAVARRAAAANGYGGGGPHRLHVLHLVEEDRPHLVWLDRLRTRPKLSSDTAAPGPSSAAGPSHPVTSPDGSDGPANPSTSTPVDNPCGGPDVVARRLQDAGGSLDDLRAAVRTFARENDLPVPARIPADLRTRGGTALAHPRILQFVADWLEELEAAGEVA